MTHASLFSGVGGFDLAAQWAGWTNVFNCEINPFCQTVLKYHFPNATQYSDITTTDFTVWRGKIDVLTGGFPCQPFSVAGKRKGSDDDRYLWPEMLRAIREIRPTWVIGENVNGITSMVLPVEITNMEEQATSLFEDNQIIEIEEQRFVIDRICEDLEQAGYSVQPIVIPACAVGAPHRRDRVWFVAYRADARLEAVREWKDGVYGLGSIAHADNRFGFGTENEIQARGCAARNGVTVLIANPEGLRWSERSGSSDRENDNSSERRDVHGGVEGFSGQRVTADTCGERCDNGSDNRQKRHVPNDERFTTEDQSERNGWQFGIGENGNTTPDTSSQQGQRLRSQQREVGEPEQGKFGRGGGEIYAKNYWSHFPTQSPVCRGDDGLSDRLDPDTVFKGVKQSARAKAFTRWRQEAIKAYGNAIVSQVEYQICKTINQITNQI